MIEKSIMIESEVIESVSGEHAQGFCIRQRRLTRDSALLFAVKSEVNGSCRLDTA